MTETTKPASVALCRIREMLSRSISTDGEHAQIAFALNGSDDKLVIEFNVHSLGQLQSIVAELRRQAKRRDLSGGQVMRQMPKSFSVGHSDDMRGHVAIMFDENTLDEQIFMLRDQDAAKLANAIAKDVRERGGPSRSGIFMPNGGFIPVKQ